MSWVVSLWVLFVAPVLAATPTLYDYGKQCAQTLGVEIPKIDCLDPAATLLPITVQGKPVDQMVEECDKPALLTDQKACIPGARVHRFDQTNARGQKVQTVVFCRRTRTAAAKLQPPELLTHAYFQDVGLIQYNTQTHQACWYFMEEDEVGKPSTAIPRPYSSSWADGAANPEAKAANEYWMSAERTNQSHCIKCHDNGVWLRSPFIAQAAGTPNAVPGNPLAQVTHVTVGDLYTDWNGPHLPTSIEIDEDAWLKAQPESEQAVYRRKIAAKEVTSAATCTNCHRLGKGEYDGLGTCGYLLDSAIGEGTPRGFSQNAWMPPAHGQTAAQWKDYYGYAVSAAKACCANPQLAFCKP